ncbi:hypothetical protein F7Q99_37425 [Streptomyces kaniharaensis]|uniref:Uncharacterized protein n=1 Tax=Streptomyces kaniharaensis TaxID=212423 RepID=A0A6N7L277_9ACTN|nr:hypothetical protein [Streptomyces kaniharaensis]MQS17721.1 hypothetical protein [Streptomyces kaniharaensis]
MVTGRQQLQRGYFLREAAALQRANTGGSRRLDRIAFAEGEPVVVVGTPGATVRLPVGASRDELYAALAEDGGWTVPDRRASAWLPATAPAPPLAVYADLLDDLGDLVFTLTTYPADVGRPEVAARLDAVRLVGGATAVVEVSALGGSHRVRIPLDSGVPLVAVPLAIAERLLAAGEGLGTDWDYPVEQR